MKKLVWLSFLIGLSFSIAPLGGGVYAGAGLEPGQTQTLSSFVDSWTQTDAAADTQTQPLRGADPDKKAYLTFDDGPDPVWSPKVLEVLSKYGVHATFYVLGRNAAAYQDMIVQIARAGNTLANHSYNHYDLSAMDFQNFSLEVGDTEQAVRNALGDHPELQNQVTKCLRPPYGKADDRTYSYAYSLGYSISMWNLDTRDWAGGKPEAILAEFLKNLQPESVILFHDGGQDRLNTVKSLDLVLHELMMQGYQVLPFCTQVGQAVIN